MKAGIIFYSKALRERYGHAIYARFNTTTPNGSADHRAAGAFNGITIYVLTGRELQQGRRYVPEAQMLPEEDQQAVLDHFKRLIEEHCPECFRSVRFGGFRYPYRKVVDNMETEKLVAGYHLAKKVEQGTLVFANETLNGERFEVMAGTSAVWKTLIAESDNTYPFFRYESSPLMNDMVEFA